MWRAFSDLTGSKQRLALLVTTIGRGDWVACKIRSKPYRDQRAITLGVDAFDEGGLQHLSFVRPGKLFTANPDLDAGPVGLPTENKLLRVRRAVLTLIMGERPRAARATSCLGMTLQDRTGGVPPPQRQ